ncbi:stage II sporulation protein R [Selenihalanaerobacter shriftii]|uniref:Stage II sporulation protein R n=1 Tax=Selenihalanaerobacter shriftii TaxID=142842 RepID=A0A1T4K5Z5_9FIRM|nr:stage II sporulation protein R [Selenihalanaerobacter shriftii]SJZ37735.1 stage II sporulation protein R [Selenihalanaerobacter shriftii]
MHQYKRFRLIVVTVVAIVMLVALGYSSAIVVSPKSSTMAYTNNNLLRLHVIANSNSLMDQRLKRQVRNGIINQTEGLFKNIDDIQKARNLIKNNLGYIEKIVETELARQGNNYDVNVKLGNYQFPKRTYGNMTLPAGNYKALRVIIGQGKGENWWCVLFPPFCYIDSVDKQEGSKQLGSVKKEDVDIKMKSKLLEYLNENHTLAKKMKKVKGLLMMSVTDFNNSFNE